MLSPSDFADDARVSGDLTSTVRERVSVRRNKLALVEGAAVANDDLRRVLVRHEDSGGW